MSTGDGRRARGDATRHIVLTHAADLASLEGLDGLSIARLAAAADVSKSGVATLFGTKEQLQIATVAAARERFIVAVVEPARVHPRGLKRVDALLANWIEYSRSRVFPGGCFFVSAAVDFDAKPGPVRDAIQAAMNEWRGYLGASLNAAIECGELAADADAAQLAFECTAMLDSANMMSLLNNSDEPYEHGRRAVERMLRLDSTSALARLSSAD